MNIKKHCPECERLGYPCCTKCANREYQRRYKERLQSGYIPKQYKGRLELAGVEYQDCLFTREILNLR